MARATRPHGLRRDGDHVAAVADDRSCPRRGTRSSHGHAVADGSATGSDVNSGISFSVATVLGLAQLASSTARAACRLPLSMPSGRRPAAPRPRMAPDRRRARGDVAILADGAVVQVDLHQRRHVDALAIAHAEVERRADDDDDIGLGEGVASACGRNGADRPAAAGRGCAVEVAGNVEAAQQRDRLRPGRARPRPAGRTGSPGARP